MAASLAVITAVISTWSSQKIIWKQEDELEPDLIVGFDLDSRSGLIQLLIMNKGGGNAYDVSIEWIKPLIGFNNKIINFNLIHTFLKGETYRVIVAGSVKTFEEAKSLNQELIFTGKVKYKIGKRSKSHRTSYFEISLEPYRNKARPYSDEQEYYLRNAGLTKALGEIQESINNLTNVLKQKKEEQ